MIQAGQLADDIDPLFREFVKFIVVTMDAAVLRYRCKAFVQSGDVV